MTISYHADVATCHWWSFLRVIFRWRASVWQSVLFEFSAWILLYYLVFIIYHLELAKEWKHDFLVFARHVDKRLEWIALSFILGFYVTQVVDRWKRIFENVGFTDNVWLALNTFVRGMDEETRRTRCSIARWLCLAQVMVLRDVSIRVRKRFPTIDSLEEAALLAPGEERKAMEKAMAGDYPCYWLPFNWTHAICAQLREKNVIKSDNFLVNLLTEVRRIRDNLQRLYNYDWVPIPLAYSQVVSFAVRAYFILCLVARQPYAKEFDRDEHAGFSLHLFNTSQVVYIYIPYMTLIQLIIYVGWLKVAEALLNPMGEDDDDFECNFIIDRNLVVAMLLVDDFHCEVPPTNWECPHQVLSLTGMSLFQGFPLYSEEAAALPQHPLLGSAFVAAHETMESSEDNWTEPTTPVPVRRVKMVPRRSLWVGNKKQMAEDGTTTRQQTLTRRHRGSSAVLRLFSTRLRKSENSTPPTCTVTPATVQRAETFELGRSQLP